MAWSSASPSVPVRAGPFGPASRCVVAIVRTVVRRCSIAMSFDGSSGRRRSGWRRGVDGRSVDTCRRPSSGDLEQRSAAEGRSIVVLATQLTDDAKVVRVEVVGVTVDDNHLQGNAAQAG